jgi:hypothetical protein
MHPADLETAVFSPPPVATPPRRAEITGGSTQGPALAQPNRRPAQSADDRRGPYRVRLVPISLEAPIEAAPSNHARAACAPQAARRTSPQIR